MTNEQDINLRVNAEDNASKVIDDVEKSTGGLGQTISKVSTIASGFLAADVVQQGIGKVTGFVNDSVAAIKESIQVNAQLDAVLKSTGGAAGVTAEGLREYAASLEKNSLFEDEAILNGQNLLLTFTNIKNEAGEGNNIFDQTSQIMLDMAQAMGTDASGSAIMLGKALNDPEKGISALTRVGVTFTEEQKNQIKVMQEAGDTAGAQKVILAELNKEFGGSAKAASDAAGAAEIQKDKMNDLQETIGAKVLPIQQKWMELQIIIIDFIANKVIPTLESLYEKYWPSVSKAIEEATAIVQEHWGTITTIFEFVEDFVRTKIEGMIQIVSGLVETVTGVVNLIDDLVHGRWSQIWGDLEQIVNGIVESLIGYIRWQFGQIPDIIIGQLEELPNRMAAIGRRSAQAFLDSISIAGVSVGDVVGTVSSIFGHAGGGTGNGWSWVGENGPELAYLGAGGYVMNNQQSMRGNSGANNINFYVENLIADSESNANIAANNLAFGLVAATKSRGYD